MSATPRRCGFSNSLKEAPHGLEDPFNKSIQKEGLLPTKRLERNRMNFKGKMVSIGIDMHKLFRRITAILQGDFVRVGANPQYSAKMM